MGRGLTDITFTISDIEDKEALYAEIEKETRRIYGSAKARNGRSIEEIRDSVTRGKVAERWLIEN